MNWLHGVSREGLAPTELGTRESGHPNNTLAHKYHKDSGKAVFFSEGESKRCFEVSIFEMKSY